MTTSKLKPKPMTPRDAWLYAASWGSIIRLGDPGACMYGFSETCRPRNEAHRQAVIRYCETDCIPLVENHPEWYDKREMGRMLRFLDYIRTAPLVYEEQAK
jgi:hypothetical protein